MSSERPEPGAAPKSDPTDASRAFVQYLVDKLINDTRFRTDFISDSRSVLDTPEFARVLASVRQTYPEQPLVEQRCRVSCADEGENTTCQLTCGITD